MNSEYVEIIVESYWHSGRGKRSTICVRPIAGELYPQNLDVACSRTIREGYPVGTRFRARVKLTNREGSGDYLRAHNNEIEPL